MTAGEAIFGAVVTARRDHALIARAQAGEAEAFDALMRPRLERLLRIALSIMANEADARDVVQESCILVWRQLPQLRDPDRFEGWLSRIVVNGCRSALRDKHRASIREIPSALLDADSVGSPSADGPGEETAAAVLRRGFARLDPDKRAIVVLHHIDGRSVMEIAGLLRVPEGTVKWRLHAARKALARALEVER